MTLQPDPSTPGLWINPHWQDNTPGTFAVVIGVSRYEHLDGGGQPAEDLGERWILEARRLGQLKVSALTAFDFFCWLADGYRFDPAPIAKCWLLLAPTKDEQQAPRILEHAAIPTLQQCQRAVRAWRGAMARLAKPVQQQSRSLFFFSGHGLQVSHERQILLPSDYLGGDSPSWDDSLSTYNLRYGLESLELPHRFYFVDACRNDFPEIRGKNPRGRAILPEHEAAHAYPGIRAAAVLYATAASLQAWQPVKAEEGASLYGRALLEGLRGPPDIELRPGNGSVHVCFGKLEGFVNARVVELLKQYQATVLQPVQPSGIVRDEVVTEIPKTELLVLRPGLGVPPTKGPDGALVLPGARSAKQRSGDLQRALQENLFAPRSAAGPVPGERWPHEVAADHHIFGSEQVTEIFVNRLRLLAQGQQKWLELERLKLLNVQFDDQVRFLQLELEIDDHDRLGHWLQVVDLAGTAHGIVLASDRTVPPRYLIEVDLVREQAGEGRITRFEGGLSLSNPGLLGAAAELWRRYRTADVMEAVGEFELGELQQMVREKLESPLAATVAGLILLRAGRSDLLHDWLRNLANWFPDLPDGPVLWAEQVLRDEPDKQRAVGEAAEYLGTLVERGLPQTSEALSYAASLAERLQSRASDLSEGMRERLSLVQQRLDAALAFFHPGGLFASYAHFEPAATEAPAGRYPTSGTATTGPLRIALTEDWVDIGGVRLKRRR